MLLLDVMRARRSGAALWAVLWVFCACSARNPAYRAASAEADVAPEELPDVATTSDARAVSPDAAEQPDLAPKIAPDAEVTPVDAGVDSPPDVSPDTTPDRPRPGAALLVVGNVNLSPSDRQLQTVLRTLGFTVTTMDGDDTSAASAANKGVVVISGSSWSAEVSGQFRNVAVPVVVFDHAVFAPMQMTGTQEGTHFGELRDARTLEVIQPKHPLAAGLSGPVIIAERNNRMSWGVPSASAVFVATMVGQPNRFTIFGYEAGVEMVNMIAPERRVGAFVRYPDDTQFTAAGLQLFEAAVLWAAHYR